MEFTGNDIQPDISDEENKINMENLFNTICRIRKIDGFSHCIYDPLKKDIHIYIEE